MHIAQTYRRESARQIAERIMRGGQGTPVFTSSAKDDDRRYDQQRKQNA